MRAHAQAPVPTPSWRLPSLGKGFDVVHDMTFGPFRVIRGERLLLRSNQPVSLPSAAYEILLVLLERSGQLVPKSELIEHISAGKLISESQLRVYIARLRKALQEGRRGLRYVENVTGHGYRLVVPGNLVHTGASFEFGPFELIPDRRLLLRAGIPVNVPSRAWEILLALIERAGELVGKADLLARVWPRVVVEEGTLRVHIAGLRRILRDRQDGWRYIENVTGLGYRFVAAMHRSDSRASTGADRRIARAVASIFDMAGEAPQEA